MKRVLTLGLLALTMALGAQTLSEKQDITIFPLSYFGPKATGSVAATVDARIKEVFVNLGRFNVLGLDLRLDAVNIEDFVRRIREIKEASTTLPAAVRFGEVIFTEADFNKLVGSFFVVIPQVTNFTVETTGRGNWRASVFASITILRGSDLSAVKVINLELTSTAETQGEATSDAINQLPTQLTFEIRKMDEFAIKSGIIGQERGQYLIELGKNMGILPGDEYRILRRTTVAGFENVEEKGILLITDVQNEFSRAIALDGTPVLGDPIKEVARLMDADVYFAAGKAVVGNNGNNIYLLGLKASGIRGLGLSPRPYVAVEVPLGLDMGFLGFFFVPANVFAGVEFPVYMGRLEIKPGAALGAGLMYPLDAVGEEGAEYLTHYGARAELEANLLFGNDLRIGATAGAQAMIGATSFAAFSQSYFGTYVLPWVSVNVVLKL